MGPTTDRELNACPAMRQEFRYSLAAFDGPRLPGETTLRERIVLRTVDRRQLIARSALQSAVFCTPRALSQARADHSLHAMAVAEPATCSAFRVAIDPFGCLLVEIRGEDPLSRYVDRRIDQAAALSLLRTVIWLRRQPGGPDAWPLALERRPGSLGLRRAPRLSPDGKLVSISLLYAGKGERLALPIGPPGAD